MRVCEVRLAPNADISVPPLRGRFGSNYLS